MSAFLSFRVAIQDDQENDLIVIDNSKQMIPVYLQLTRSASFQGSVNEFSVWGLPDPYILDKIGVRIARKNRIRIDAGYNGNNFLLCKGQLGVSKNDFSIERTGFTVKFLEFGDGLDFGNTLNKKIITENYKNISVKEAFKKVTNNNVSFQTTKNLDKIDNFGAGNFIDWIDNTCKKYDLQYYFFNSKLIIYSRKDNTSKTLDLQNPFQLKSNAILESTDPYLILENEVGDKPARIWSCNTIFNPFIKPAWRVKTMTKEGKEIEGIIGTVIYTIDISPLENKFSGMNTLKIFEEVN